MNEVKTNLKLYKKNAICNILKNMKEVQDCRDIILVVQTTISQCFYVYRKTSLAVCDRLLLIIYFNSLLAQIKTPL